MKNLPLIFSIAALLIAIVFGVISLGSGKTATKENSGNKADSLTVTKTEGIAFMDLDRVIQEYDMANDLGAVVETKVKNIQDEVNRRGKKLEKDVADFQAKIDKGLVTRSTAEIQGQKLQKQQDDFNAYANQKNNEIMEEQAVMMNQIADAIKTFIDKYNEEKQYTMILTNQRGVPVITADAALDITDEVIALLNEEYVKTKDTKSDK